MLSEIRAEMPEVDLLYVADRANAPYGPRPMAEVVERSVTIAEWLIAEGCETLVVACNTASAAALQTLRDRFPEIPVVGMEPAVKPAANMSGNGVVAVFATEVTFQGQLFARLKSIYGSNIEVLEVVCPEWVELVESGRTQRSQVGDLVVAKIRPTLTFGADTLVLGCTHFSFLRGVIEEAAEGQARVIDPAPSVARQTRRIAATTQESGAVTLTASGDLSEFTGLVGHLTKLDTGFPALPFPS